MPEKMDKYTVDLDQVLNDFEYSELTDQHSKNVSERPQSNLPFQPAPVTKHSINNVFHSLNEYLNSGINSGSGSSSVGESYAPENPEKLCINDNKIQYNAEQVFSGVDEGHDNVIDSLDNIVDQNEEVTCKTEYKDINQAEVDQGITKSNSQETSSILVNYKEETSTNDEQSKLEHLETVKIINDFEENNVHSTKTETPHFSLLETENAESKCFSQECTEKESTNVDNDLDCDRNVINKADSELGKDDCKEIYSEANSFYQSARGDVDVNSVEIMEHKYDLSENREDILVNIEEESVDSETKLENFIIEVSNSPYALGTYDSQEKSEKLNEKSIDKEDTTSNKDIEPESTELNNTATSAKENADDSVITTQVNLSEDVNNLENVPKSDLDQSVTPSKVIGFSADIDIDESELNKMLEELELEEDGSDCAHVEDVTVEHLKEKLDASEVIMGNAEKVVENITDVDEGPNEVENINTVVPVSNNQTTNPDSPPNLHQQTVLINSDNVESQIPNSEPTEEDLHSEIIECLEMEKPSGKSKKTSKKPSKSSQESIPIVEPTEEPKEQEVKNEGEPSQQKEGLSRPQNLPLNNELSDENVGRKINLIGSPGSTPYNNVYINKSIEPKTTQDTESDYTSSASPTFSDCSTESTSTASTVSVEDVPNNADKFAKKSSGVKNTNVESESRESRKDRNAGEGVAEKENNVQESTNSDQNINVEGAANINDDATNATENALNDSETGAGDVQSSQSTDTFLDKSWLGKEAPLWIPDADASSCLHCDMKFTVLKRRHHCRACGLVLCSKCCNLKFRLDYLESDARVCNKCYNILNKDTPNNAGSNHNSPESGNSPAFRPNPNNPLEYCSTVSPLQQAGQAGAHPPSVMVPVGVLKRKGSNKKSNKSVMFCDGIAPGSDLTHLDQDFNYNNSDSKTQKSLNKGPEDEEEKKTKEEPPPPSPVVAPAAKVSRNQPKIDEDTGCFIPKSETSLPPTISVNKTDILYSDCSNSPSVVEMLKNESLVFAINQNVFVNVKVINMSCCINKQAWCFCTEGLINVGSDEVVYLIEYIEEESFVPKDVFFHIHNVYVDAVKGTSIKELGLSLHNTSNFLDSRNHAGFVYIKPTFQCLENLIVPKEPFLIGILIHRWETPWAKLFPLRLILRLGAEYRYYPSPLISTRHRDSVFVEIGHTIINLLADFRNFTYTLPQIRGLIIHMEDKKTTITIPKNRYDQVMKSINNSSDHILAFAGNFSCEADSHLVCIQDTQGHENCYTTHAINIHNKPRKVTGASFIVFNGSLKSSSGLTAKSNIVEDGLMIQIPSEHMDKIRDNLRNMKNHTIACGCINAVSDETVNIVWGENDVDFNAGVNSPVDLSAMKGVPSIRVHNGKDYFCNTGTRLIRWTEVFIMQSGEDNPKHQDPVDISKVSESIAKACCTALVKYLDLLVSNSCQKIGIRTTLHVENVSYSAGSNGLKLPPIYMRSLDNELIPVLHRITSNNLGDNAIVLELIFRILNA